VGLLALTAPVWPHSFQPGSLPDWERR